MTPLRLTNADEIPSPALLLVREGIEANLKKMLAMVRGPQWLRPHIKTHKIPELVRRQIELGIHQFKCATIAEAEMAAAAGARDVLLALQPVGPNARRFLLLRSTFPNTRFSAVVDDAAAVRDLARLVDGKPIYLLIDLDIGQHRTGVEPGPAALALAQVLASTPEVAFDGLHAYDGHIHDRDVEARRTACEKSFARVRECQRHLENAGIPVKRVVAGGTPTFPFHAQRGDVECSPGTCVLWDAGYAAGYPDLEFVPAAFLLARVVSRPTPTRVCLDLGHKAVASEMPHPRVVFPEIPEATPVAHNEEHLVLETPRASNWPVGAACVGIPWHVCPTVALHAEAWLVENGTARESWAVIGRARRLHI